MIALLKDIDFFNNNKQLTYSDYRELAQLMTYVEFEQDQFIYKSGDTAENFYVILNGQVDQKMKNPVIDQWDWAYSIYEALLDWKKNEFDEKVS